MIFGSEVTQGESRVGRVRRVKRAKVDASNASQGTESERSAPCNEGGRYFIRFQLDEKPRDDAVRIFWRRARLWSGPP